MDGSRFSDQDQKGGLKSILRILVMIEHSAAHAPHHRTMAPYQSGESRFVATLDKPSQELAITESRPIVQKD
jgi:hypothetical protein